MAGLIDVAYVEILPDLKKFDKQATKDIKASLGGAAKEADKATKEIGESLSDSVRDGAEKAKVWVDKLGREIREVDGTIHIKTVVDGKETVETLKRDIQGRFRKSNGQFASAGELAGLGIANGVKSGLLDGLVGVADVVSKSLSAAGPYIQAAAIALGAAVAVPLTGAIGPAVVALGASLPAAMGIAGAAIGTLTLGFKGLSDAIDSMDDAKKFEEALKNLSPAARNFSIELRNLVPTFKSIKDAAQEGLFKGFEGEITHLLSVIQGPLKVGFFEVGQSLQGLVKQVTGFVGSRVGIDAINTVFGTTSQIIDKLSLSMTPFLEGIGKLAISATPFIEKLFGKFSEFLANVGVKLSELSDNGSLEKFFDEAYETLSKVWDIGKNVYDILKNIFSSAEGSGQDLLDTLKDITKEIKEFFDNKTNVEALKTSFLLFAAAVRITWGIIKIAVGATKEFLEELDKLDQDLDNFTQNLEDFGKDVEEKFNKAKDKVKEFVDGVGNWFSQLPGRIQSFLESIPGLVANFFKDALASALQALGIGIGLIIYTFTELPGQVGSALLGLWDTVTKFFTDLWNSVSEWTTTKWNELVAWLSLLPEKIWAALSALPGILSNFFTQLWTDVRNWAVDAWNSIIDWISQVPGKIEDLVVNFYNSGINLIKGFFRGISSGAENAASRVGDAVYSAFKSSLNWAIRQINEGIASVDDSLPGSLPRIPMLAAGGIAMGPAIVGEAGPEMALPLTGQRGRKAMQMLANAVNGSGGSINFGEGSIAISFEGAVPTRDQAYQVGEAVGSGVMAILKKREARTLIRMA